MLSMRYLHAQTAARWHPPPPHQCGYACLLCLNSGSVAPLVGFSIMMLRIISCSVKGYTSLSLDMFVSKHHYMLVCVFLWPFVLYSCNIQICSIWHHCSMWMLAQKYFKWLSPLHVEPRGSLNTDPEMNPNFLIFKCKIKVWTNRQINSSKFTKSNS